MAKNSARPKNAKKKKTTSKKSTSKSSSPSWLRENWKTTAVIIIVVLAVCTVAYRKYESYQEKERFEQARHNIEKLVIYAQKSSNGTIVIKNKDACRYSSAKFSRGSLSCSTSADVLIPNLDDTEANKLIDNFQKQIQEQSRNEGSDLKTIQMPISHEDELNNKNTQSFKFNDVGNKPTCYAVYSRKPSIEGNIGHINQSNLYIFISCYGSAKTEHYPLSN